MKSILEKNTLIPAFNELKITDKNTAYTPIIITHPSSAKFKIKALAPKDLSYKGKRVKPFSTEHKMGLGEFFPKTILTKDNRTSSLYSIALNRLEELKQRNYYCLPTGLLDGLIRLSINIDDKYIKTLECTDETWINEIKSKAKRRSNNLWNSSNKQISIGFSALHFLFEQNLQSNKKSWDIIKQNINLRITSGLFVLRTDHNNENIVNGFLKLYLFINTIHELHSHGNIRFWTDKQYSKLNIWNDAINDSIIQQTRAKTLSITHTSIQY